MNIENFIDTAIDFRASKIRAKELGIINIYDYLIEEFLITDKVFKNIAKDRNYTIKAFNENYEFEYKVTICGLNFVALTKELLFEGDEGRITEVDSEQALYHL